MSAINTFLTSINNQPPALLQVGADKAENYRNLAALNTLWSDDQSVWSGSGAGAGALDTVTLAYKKIGGQIVDDLAALAAEAIKEDPSLENDYIIALVEGDRGREARVYRRSDFLAGFEGAEKKALEESLAANPLLVVEGSDKPPATSKDPACLKLAEALNGFLKKTNKTLNSLSQAGYDPFLDFRASDSMKKALARFSPAQAGAEA